MDRGRCANREQGAVLLEVVLALTLFVFAATVITSGLNASIRQLERLRLNLHASNLAASILAEMQIGLRPCASSSPESLPEPFNLWTWESAVMAVNENATQTSTALQSVEIIVRHRTGTVTRRLVQWLPTSAATNAPAAMDTFDGPE